MLFGVGDGVSVAFFLAQRDQVGGKAGAVHLHPGGQPVMDAIGHFRRARLGEGEAEDLFGAHPLQQQAEDARGQHMGLSGAGGGRQPDMGVGRGGQRRRAAAGAPKLSLSDFV